MYSFIKVFLIFLCLRIRLYTVHWIHYNPVIVDFSYLIEVAEVVEADLAIERQEELIHLPCDTHVDVTEPAVHMYEHDIVVEDE